LSLILRVWRVDKIIQSIRIGIYLLLIAVMVLSQLLQNHFSNWDLAKSFYFVSLFGLIVHGSAYLFDKVYQNKKALLGSFIIDLLLISFFLYQTELNQTIFLFLYFILILLAGIYF